ncbi:MAG TPA: GGDEF domain-containing protein [Cellvibrionaceae bacterium]|nr:GGDEF domain-containing protein [Cellvibrionaceae bacterium]HMY38002.1 GGDEF domain-containing protein [Marinagarivorans sp.]HNG58219.1 GGDEF domain-containing protein [Cellvibrionaceae bacterium]
MRIVLTRHDKWLLGAIAFSLLCLPLPHLLPMRVTSLLQAQVSLRSSIYADSSDQEVQWLNKEKLHWICRVRAEYSAKACGFSLAFDPSLDWQDAYGLRIALAAQSKNQFFRLYVRNHVPGAAGTLPEDAQYNQMMLPAQDANQPVDIAFSEFALADWWLASHPVANEYNIARFDHVSSLGIDLDSPAALGDHELQLAQLALLRPYISVQTCYLSLLGLWTALLLLLSLQRLWLRRLLLAQARANIESQKPAVVEFEESAPAFCEIPQDDLTGIYNRQGFIDYWSQASRLWADNDSMGLLVVNLDQYTSIGESFGRDAKDQALLALADALKSHMRPQDKLARWHEGQFILLCPLTGHAQALQLAEKLRHHINLISFDEPAPLSLSASIGVILFPAQALLEQAYNRCELALNTTASNGNRVIDCGVLNLD